MITQKHRKHIDYIADHIYDKIDQEIWEIKANSESHILIKRKLTIFRKHKYEDLLLLFEFMKSKGYRLLAEFYN